MPANAAPSPDKAPRAATPAPRPSASATPPPAADRDPLVGRTIGGCEILERIGKGGMGALYRARQLALERTVAFKVIAESLARDESLLRRFQREAKTIARFTSSRIVQVHDVGFDQGIHYILLEYIPGGDLKSKTRARGRLPVEEAVRYIRQAAEGLLAAEREKIVHRDLKPENLMIDANGDVKVTDFGLAKPLEGDGSLTLTGEYLGTPVYMSPEQAQGLPLDHQSDMYSLGATFAFLVTGMPPVSGVNLYEVLKKKAQSESLDPRGDAGKSALPEGLCEVIKRMTALRPCDRYASFRDLIADLDVCLNARPIAARRRRARRWVLAAVSILGLLGAAFAIAHYGAELPALGFFSEVENPAPKAATGAPSRPPSTRPSTAPRSSAGPASPAPRGAK